ncbi:hypothetical protein [Aliarcobacter lanthieri]|uniref:hypothetical protein n=1 Tax=Aliarcobacter lanthieri TaxID=1355374 RepID=UPI000478D0C6|nr:hypothetical protein [Aliarcobacter lanthieri]
MNFDLKTYLKQTTKRKSYEIRAYKHTENFEAELENFLAFMNEKIGERFKNQVLNKLNVSTINKFQDAQVGNFAIVFRTLSRIAIRMLLKQFSNKRLEKYIKALYLKVNIANQSNIYKAIEKDIGINIKDIIKTDGLNSFVNANSLKTLLQIESTRDKAIEDMSNNLLRLMTMGQSLDTLYEEVENVTGKNKNKSKLVARQELTVFNSQLNKKRAANLGFTQRKWNAVGGNSGSARTRKCHTARNGKTYPVDGKLYSSCDGKSLEVGEEINCRCWDTFVMDLED